MRYKTITFRVPIPSFSLRSFVCWTIYLVCWIAARLVIYEVETLRAMTALILISLGVAVLTFRDSYEANKVNP